MQDSTTANTVPPFAPPLVLVTGGNGWLGRRLVEALTAGAEQTRAITPGGLRVRCLVSPQDDSDVLQRAGVEIVRGDIRDSGAHARFLEGASGASLIHLAGIIHPQKVADFEAINTRGTLNLLDAARDAGVTRMTVMSSNSPIGCNPHPDHRFTEESPYNPYMGYGRSKWKMELGLRAAIGKPGYPEIVILRAPWFYGPGQPPRQTQFFSMIKAGKFPIVGNGANRRSMGYVDNLVQGIVRAAASPRAVGEIYWLADKVPYSMVEIIDTVRDVLRDDFGMKVAPATVRLPGLVGDVATLADWMLQKAGIYQQQIHVLSEMNKTIACEVTKAEREIGYRPEIALREGMRRSVEWCLANGQAI